MFGPFKEFYKQLTNPEFNATTDVYAPMFVCDFINFLIIVFGYQAFGPSVSNREVWEILNFSSQTVK